MMICLGIFAAGFLGFVIGFILGSDSQSHCCNVFPKNNDSENNLTKKKSEEPSELYGLAAWCKVWCDYCELPDEKIEEEMLRRIKSVNKNKVKSELEEASEKALERFDKRVRIRPISEKEKDESNAPI